MPKAVVELRADSKQFQASMKNAANSLKTASRTMQQNWAPISRTLKRVAIGIVAIGTAAVVMAANFDKGVAEITTLMGDVAPAAVKQMSDEMRTLSVESGQAIDKLVKARYDIVSAGFTGAAEGAELLNVAVKTAIGGVSDVATTADLLTTALNSYQLSADNAAHVSDLLFTTVRLGKTTMDELGESLGMVLPISNAAKVSLEDVGAAMATITASGLNTRVATTALRGAIDTLSAPTKEARAAMEEFGIEVKRNQDGTMDFLNTIRQFQGLSPDVVSRIIPDRRARVAVLSMANNFEKLQDNVEQFKETAGATDEAVRKMSETFSFKLNQATATFKDIMIEIGTAALPPLNEALGKLRAMMPEIREQVTKIAAGFGELVYWIVDHVDLAVKLLAVAVAFKAIGLAINAANIGMAVVGFAKLHPYVMAATVAIAGISAAILYFKDQSDKLDTSTNKLSQSLQTEKSRMDALFIAIQDANTPTKIRNILIKEINEKYGQYLTNLIDENTSLKDIKTAHEDVTTAMYDRITAALAQEEITEIMRNNADATKIAKKAEDDYSDSVLNTIVALADYNKIMGTNLTMEDLLNESHAKGISNLDDMKQSVLWVNHEQMKANKTNDKAQTALQNVIIEIAAAKGKYGDLVEAVKKYNAVLSQTPPTPSVIPTAPGAPAAAIGMPEIPDFAALSTKLPKLRIPVAIEEPPMDNFLEYINGMQTKNKLMYENNMIAASEYYNETLVNARMLHDEQVRLHGENSIQALQASADIIAIKQDEADRIDSINKTALGTFLEDNQSHIEGFQAAASELMNISNTLANYQIQESQRVARESINTARNTASEKIKAIQTSVNKEVLTEQQGADRIAIIEANLNDTIAILQQDAVDRENAIRKAQKPFLIAQAIANTAMGVTGALGNQPWGPWNFILAGLVAAAGAVQVSTITAQKFASGGDFTTSGQQTIVVGDNPSGKERVKITPSENSDSFGESGGDTYKVYIYANDPRSFEDYINTSGKKPLINFIKETTKRREL